MTADDGTLTREQIEQIRAGEFVGLPALGTLCNMALRSLDDGWRGIESAPRDGTRVLGFDPAQGRGVAICHLEYGSKKWYPSDEAAKFDGFFQPTHWQPLPTAPEVKP